MVRHHCWYLQVIPHNFGRQRPPIISSQKMVEDKIRMCDVLSDIEVAQDLLDPKQEEEEEEMKRQPHPADEKYASLQADLNIIQPEEEEYKIVKKFAEVTNLDVVFDVLDLHNHGVNVTAEQCANVEAQSLPMWQGISLQ